MKDWISVKDRLPEEYDTVLVFNPEYKNTNVELIKWFIGGEDEGITYWMLLPEPPEEDIEMIATVARTAMGNDEECT